MDSVIIYLPATNNLTTQENTMSKRNLVITAAVLVLLALVSQWFGRSGNNIQDAKIGNPILASSQVEAFDEVIIQNSSGKITLQKKDNRWTLAEKNSFPANVEKLLELAEKLTGSKVGSLVTKDEKRLGYFKVVYWDDAVASAESSGTQLTLNSQGQKIFSMMVGKQRQSKSGQPDGAYIRIGNDPIVYLIKENLTMETDPVEWIQASLFKLDKKEVNSVVLETSGDRIKLERKEKGKNMKLAGLKGGQKTAEYEVSSILSDLENFKIDDLVARSQAQEKALELKSVVTVSVYDSPDLSFKVLSQPLVQKADGEEEEKYYISLVTPNDPKAQQKWGDVYNLGENWLFEMADWKAKRWVKAREDFIEDKK